MSLRKRIENLENLLKLRKMAAIRVIVMKRGMSEEEGEKILEEKAAEIMAAREIPRTDGSPALLVIRKGSTVRESG